MLFVGPGSRTFRFHDLRHCAVTNLRKAGVNDSVIMSISGHKTYAMFKRYNRIDRQDRVNALKQVERQFDTDMTRSLCRPGGEVVEALKNMVGETGFEPVTPCV